MQNSNVLIGQALSTLKGNLDRTGDPLGFTRPYWTDWARQLPFPRRGPCILVTARMYQMLPFVLQATALSTSMRPLLPMLLSRFCRQLADRGVRVAGETLMRIRAARDPQAQAIARKGRRALEGIGAALGRIDRTPAYLYENDPYSGVLLYDLGMESEAIPHMRAVYRLLKASGARQVITTDPHTTFMLKAVYPRHIAHYDLDVRHYLEIAANRRALLAGRTPQNLPATMVLHDSCVMTRDLGIVDQARQVAGALGIHILEPENNRLNTACCGGPVEYAYGELSARISRLRIKELASVSRHILVTCPICLLNLRKYQHTAGVKVWDMGELLAWALKG